jgi:hypothetical protein
MHRFYRSVLMTASLAGALAFVACGDDNNNSNTPTQPDSTGGGGDTTGTPTGPAATRLLSVTPHGGQGGIGTLSELIFTFDGAMDTTAGLLVDLHRGDSTGATSVVARQSSVRCLFSLGNTLMRCAPILPLSPNVTYLAHFGALENRDGQPITIPEGDSLGISRIARPDSAFHGTQPLDSIPAGWVNADSTLGYGFTFTTGTGTSTGGTGTGGTGTGGTGGTGTGGTGTGGTGGTGTGTGGLRTGR